jgi:hypothetical protein
MVLVPKYLVASTRCVLGSLGLFAFMNVAGLLVTGSTRGCESIDPRGNNGGSDRRIC